MINLNYNNRHTFVISFGVALIVLGLYPFYTAQSLQNLDIKFWIFHGVPTLLAVFLIGLGLKLWNVRDKNYKDFFEFKKEEIKVGNKLKIIEIEERELNLKRIKGEMKLEELKSQIKDKEKANESIEEATRAKQEELKKLKDIAEKQEKLLEDQRKILAEREKSISNLPPQVFSVSPTLSGTGSVVPPYSYGSGVYPSLAYPLGNYCIVCKKHYIPNLMFPDIGVCPDCDKSHIMF